MIRPRPSSSDATEETEKANPVLAILIWPIWANPILANPFWAILVLARPIWAKTNLGQSNFWPIKCGQFNFWPIHFWISCVLVGHLKVGPRRVGPRRVGGPKGGGPKFRAFFFPLPPLFSHFFSLWVSSRGILVLFEAPGNSNVQVWRAQTCTSG